MGHWLFLVLAVVCLCSLDEVKVIKALALCCHIYLVPAQRRWFRFPLNSVLFMENKSVWLHCLIKFWGVMRSLEFSRSFRSACCTKWGHKVVFQTGNTEAGGRERCLGRSGSSTALLAPCAVALLSSFRGLYWWEDFSFFHFCIFVVENKVWSSHLEQGYDTKRRYFLESFGSICLHFWKKKTYFYLKGREWQRDN